MTDNEIKEALKCCQTGTECFNCFLYTEECCGDILLDKTINLINRQQAEIERLKKTQRIEIHIDKEFYNECQYEIKQAKAEAIKEFAERLKGIYKDYDQNVGAVCKPVLFDDIDNLVKEMTGQEE